MAKQLIVDDIPSNHRQMAALVIKNSVIGHSSNVTQELSKQWSVIPSQQRDAIKQLVCII